LAGAALATMVSAQPAPPVAQTPPAPPAPTAPASEEAPPATVTTPSTDAATPLTEQEVAPALPPKARVAEKPVETIVRRERYNIAVLQALDKVTAETLRFEARVGQPVRWKGLIFTVSACERSAPNEPIADSIVYLKIDSQPRPQPGRPSPPSREAFKGWMFAASPGLNPLQHASYDAWAISCRTNAPPIPVASTAVRPPASRAPATTLAAPSVVTAPAISPAPTAAPDPVTTAPEPSPPTP
jgi:hypothetical protein